jgi:trehalose 6-phosphate phosphatase
VFSLLPRDAADKGSALEQLMRISGARSAIYVGDDVTDEDVFQLRRRDLLSVRVEHAPGSAAEFFLHHWLDIVQLLDALIQRLREHQARNTMQPTPANNT